MTKNKHAELTKIHTT